MEAGAVGPAAAGVKHSTALSDKVQPRAWLRLCKGIPSTDPALPMGETGMSARYKGSQAE
jgi:hypothetical protein